MIGALTLFAVLPAVASSFHFSVVRTLPTKDQKLDAPPARVQLWFSEAPAAGVSSVTLKRDAADIELGKTVIVGTEKSMYSEPVKPLTAGDYTATWRAAGDDGHVLSGEIKFSVLPKS